LPVETTLRVGELLAAQYDKFMAKVQPTDHDWYGDV